MSDAQQDQASDLASDQVADQTLDQAQPDLADGMGLDASPDAVDVNQDLSDGTDQACLPACNGKACGDQDGCGGWCNLPDTCESTNPCQEAQCTAEGCILANLDIACDDGSACTSDDTCVAGVCKGTMSAECAALCGDTTCQPEMETALSCPLDCGSCGDGVCSVSEYVGWWTTCPRDCATGCGDGLCDPLEIPLCLADCSPCGDGFCGLEESRDLCPQDCPATCGNGLCNDLENAVTCLADCMPECGDGSCDFPEGPISCPGDCTFCPDGWCTGNETVESCADDCATPPCGNGLCDGVETPASCPADCGSCGDGTCGFGETGSQCPADCAITCGDEVCQQEETAANCAWDCTLDSDLDDAPNFQDNCPFWYNYDQADSDGDGVGDECEDNDDGDAYPDVYDNCPMVDNGDQTDTDGDWYGDACDDDDDNDGTADASDCAPLNAEVHPGASEECNNRDDDCDEIVDEGGGICPDGQTCVNGVCLD